MPTALAAPVASSLGRFVTLFICAVMPVHAVSNSFPNALKLSDDTALDSLLADIPFFTIGILGFAVVTLLITVRKLTTAAVYIISAVLIAFLAAIFDLSQLLVRGVTQTDNGTGMDSVYPLVVARELGFAVSLGVSLLFFWYTAGLCPRGEAAPAPIRAISTHGPVLITSSLKHSGDWARWGYFGILLRWSLLLAIATLVVLQLIWRLVSSFNHLGPVYIVSASFQIGISALLIFKLFLNTYISTLTPRWRTVRDYSPLVVALMINAALGIGNIVCFLFSETTLGRFLQAIGFYITILYILISSFYADRDRSSLLPTEQAIAPLRQLQTSLGSSFRMSIPRRSSSNVIPSGPAGKRGVPGRASTAERLSGWLIRRISGAPFVDRSKEERLWDKERAEINTSVGNHQDDFSPGSIDHGQPALQASAPTTIGLPAASVSPTTVPAQRIRPKSIVVPTKQLVPDVRISKTQDTLDDSRSMPSYYLQAPARPVTDVPDSPVYGLNGIVRELERGGMQARTPTAAADSELKRQQAELDQSIAGLKLLSPKAASMSSKQRKSSLVPESSINSAFSLSHFPEPPKQGQSFLPGDDSLESTPDELLPATEVSRSALPSERARNLAGGLAPPRMPAASQDHARQLSLPTTDRGSYSSNLLRERIDSGGTRYDVTSFIGGLTNRPNLDAEGRPLSRVAESPVPTVPSDLDSERSVNIVRLETPPSRMRARLVEAPGQSRSPTSNQSDSEQVRDRRYPSMVPLDGAEERNTRASTVSTTLPLRTKRTVQGLPRPRGPISKPIARGQASARNDYENPRPAPRI